MRCQRHATQGYEGFGHATQAAEGRPYKASLSPQYTQPTKPDPTKKRHRAVLHRASEGYSEKKWRARHRTDSVACDNNLFILVMPTLRIHACVCPARRNRERLQVAAHMRCSNARAAARTSPPSVDIMFVPVRRWTTATHNSIHCGHRIDAGPVACDAAAGDAADGAARTRRRPLVSVRQRLLAAAVVDSGWLRRRRPHRRPLAAA